MLCEFKEQSVGKKRILKKENGWLRPCVNAEGVPTMSKKSLRGVLHFYRKLDTEQGHGAA
jgi:hypothetical protein